LKNSVFDIKLSEKSWVMEARQSLVSILRRFYMILYQQSQIRNSDERCVCYFSYALLTVLPLFIPPDDMIKSRRKEQGRPPRRAAASRRRGNTKATSSDRAVGTGKAKRDALVNFRRGRTTTNKPTPMDIEREVYRQTRKTAKQQQQQQQFSNKKKDIPNKSGARPAKRVADQKVKAKMAKQRKQQAKGKQQQGKSAVPAGPSKKAVKAAVNAMSEKGFSIPSGMQMVISFAPAPNDSKKGGGKNKGGSKQQPQQSGGGKKQQQSGKGKSGGGGRRNNRNRGGKN
jgi:hypothetical protein